MRAGVSATCGDKRSFRIREGSWSEQVPIVRFAMKTKLMVAEVKFRKFKSRKIQEKENGNEKCKQ